MIPQTIEATIIPIEELVRRTILNTQVAKATNNYSYWNLLKLKKRKHTYQSGANIDYFARFLCWNFTFWITN